MFKKFYILPAVFITILFLSACGNTSSSGNSAGDLNYDLVPADTPNFDFTSAAKKNVYYNNYNGTLTLTFKSDSQVRMRFGKFVSYAGYDVSAVNAALKKYPDVKFERSMPEFTEKFLENNYKYALSKGWHAIDWNLKYTIYAANPSKAEAIIDAVANNSAVERIWPGTTIGLSSPEQIPTPTEYKDQP
jgi:hypothetical protein